MAIFLLVLAVVVSLILVPLGLPGTWLMLAAAIGYDYLSTVGKIGWVAIGIGLALAVVAEVLEFTLAGRYARKYGGSKRAGWGALIGGFIGAFMGVPVPVIGSVIGAFAGSFIGALIAELSRRESGATVATRAATGALVGRVVATAMKLAFAVTIGVILIGGALV